MSEELTFEEAVLKLEAVVKKMESDKLPLHEAIDLYEKGVKLSAYCKKKLDEAKLKIESFGEAAEEQDSGDSQ